MRTLSFICAMLLVACLSSCSVIAGIFKAGVAVGIIVIVAVIALIIWIASMFRK